MNRIHNPMLYQGRRKKKKYFEGWYFKQATTDGKATISVIPGISMDERDPHCFIQVIVCVDPEVNQKSAFQTEYFRFPSEEFVCQDEPFSIRIGENHFSEQGMTLLLTGSVIELDGTVSFGPFQGIETSWIHPNIMGFICNLKLDGREYRFASYNRSKLDLNEFTPEHASMKFRRKQLILHVDARMEEGALLQAPHEGAMNHKIKKGLFGTINIALMTKAGETIFSGAGRQCGFELMVEVRK